MCVCVLKEEWLGRDMFSLQPSGQLLNVPGRKCANVDESELGEGAFVFYWRIVKVRQKMIARASQQLM